jgi:hypothetical protein
MELKNENILTQLKWEVDSLIAITETLTGQRENIDIRIGQSYDMFPTFITSIRKKLNELSKDYEETAQEEF